MPKRKHLLTVVVETDVGADDARRMLQHSLNLVLPGCTVRQPDRLHLSKGTDVRN